MSASCPDCGAWLAEGQTCRGLFEASQLAELKQPEYFAMHHLSVPCYLLQRNGYSREGWLATRQLLRQFVEEKLSPAAARQRARALVEAGKSEGSLTRGDRHPGVGKITWTRTVADLRLDSSEHYGEDVVRWAKSVLQDSAELT